MWESGEEEEEEEEEESLFRRRWRGGRGARQMWGVSMGEGGETASE